ncbi:DnaB-like helicase C-terminal domain-containing protein [Streptomyces sp. MA15]|uniref:DnaB-like helicase C-terminal domain-containing protein n=1 Tax=Streptomyces sp. MA15 TaxID=3055061 RepID=UPI00339D31B2
MDPPGPPHAGAAPFCIPDGAYSNLHDLRAHCRHLHSRMDVRLNAVDAAHLLTSGTRSLSSLYEEIPEVARCLKLLAEEPRLPIVAVSPLHRGPEQRTGKKPMLGDHVTRLLRSAVQRTHSAVPLRPAAADRHRVAAGTFCSRAQKGASGPRPP